MTTTWDLIGNSGTVPGTAPGQNFLGTQDAQPLVISTDAVERVRITADGQTWLKGVLRIDSGHVTTNSPNGALVLNAGPADATNAAGIWFRQTTVLGDITAYKDLMRVTADTLLIDSGQITSNADHGQLILNAGSPDRDAREGGGIYFRQTAVIGDISNSTDLMWVDGTGTLSLGGSLVIGLGIVTTNSPDGIRIAASKLLIDSGHVTTTSPNGALVLNAGPADATNAAGIWFRKTTSLGDNSSWTDLMLVRADGNVGIGTTTPSAKLTVNGDVSVSGDVVLTGADCAEEFDIAEAVDFEPGTVTIIDQDGCLQQSQHAYDTRVAGVISGAGDYQPGLILDRRQSQESRMPVALVGKVYCKVDAQYAPIEVGDLLTTSPTPGHAMKADDPLRAFGSVLGKALRGLSSGQGLVPILVALQ